jgi:hypothetical protein
VGGRTCTAQLHCVARAAWPAAWFTWVWSAIRSELGAGNTRGASPLPSLAGARLEQQVAVGAEGGVVEVGGVVSDATADL